MIEFEEKLKKQRDGFWLAFPDDVIKKAGIAPGMKIKFLIPEPKDDVPRGILLIMPVK